MSEASQELTPKESKAVTFYDRVSGLMIRDFESYLLMGELLREVKKIVNAFDEETGDEIFKAHQLHKALIARRDKWAGKFEEAEKLAKEKIKYFYTEQTEAGTDLPKIDGVSIGEKWSGEVLDAALIPREYLMPDIKKLEGVTNALKAATNIPGWKPKSAKTISVRS